MQRIDHLEADRFSALSAEPVLIVDAANWHSPSAPLQSVIIGLDRDGALPKIDASAFDLLLTMHRAAPRPWVSISSDDFDRSVEQAETAIRKTPQAATIAAQVLRLSENLLFDDAVQVESLAYSTLLGGGEFRHWLENLRPLPKHTVPVQPVTVGRTADTLTITLSDLASRNAMTAAMRDALYEALANALDDPSCPQVMLTGAGKCFSTGGALPEFGTAQDLAEAHLIRSLHSCARALHALGNRGTVHIHGACIGSGLEIAASAQHRFADKNAWFQLPELGMGLIPGAGGMASMPRAIGRHRTMWMLITGARLKAKQALDWGLIHRIADVP